MALSLHHNNKKKTGVMFSTLNNARNTHSFQLLFDQPDFVVFFFSVSHDHFEDNSEKTSRDLSSYACVFVLIT